MNNLGSIIDRVFGNRDGKLDWSDLPGGAPAIVAGVIDVIMLVAEIRVYDVGHRLTNSVPLALGFVAVSSVPFYLGQVAYLYNQINRRQMAISIGMIAMGLFVSAYFGFSDYLLGTTFALAQGLSFSVNAQSLYMVAVGATVLLILSGLAYALADDTIYQRIKETRLRSRAQIAANEMEIMEGLLADASTLLELEGALRSKYGDAEVDRLSLHFGHKKGSDPNSQRGPRK
jgi:MFS family permease